MEEREIWIARRYGRDLRRVLDAVSALERHDKVFFAVWRNSQRQYYLKLLADCDVPKELIKRIVFVTPEDRERLLGFHCPVVFDERLEMEERGIRAKE